MLNQTCVRPIFSLTFVLVCLLLLPLTALAADVPQTSAQVARISVSELLQLMDEESVVIVDVRIPRAWKRAGNKIPGAIRLDTHEEVARFGDSTARQQAIVLYCL
jgi:3-mercaptopyruvate sulfurtransferase SseA